MSMARVEMRPADIDQIPCLFCRVMSLADGASPRKYTIFHGQHRLTEVFAICDDCAVTLRDALDMGMRLASDQYLVGRQAKPIRNLLYSLSSLRETIAEDGARKDGAAQSLRDVLDLAGRISGALDEPPVTIKPREDEG